MRTLTNASNKWGFHIEICAQLIARVIRCNACVICELVTHTREHNHNDFGWIFVVAGVCCVWLRCCDRNNKTDGSGWKNKNEYAIISSSIGRFTIIRAVKAHCTASFVSSCRRSRCSYHLYVVYRSAESRITQIKYVLSDLLAEETKKKKIFSEFWDERQTVSCRQNVRRREIVNVESITFGSIKIYGSCDA